MTSTARPRRAAILPSMATPSAAARSPRSSTEKWFGPPITSPSAYQRPRNSTQGRERQATWARANSNSRLWCIKVKGEERGDAEKHKRHDIIPREFFFQKRDREDYKDDQGHHLLDDLELKARELAIADAICWHREAVFEQRNRPRDKDRLPKRPGVAVFQMPIPSEGHEAVRTNQQKNGAHR